MTAAPSWRPQADHLTSVLREALGDDLLAGYVHGSAALGGWVPGASDLDYLGIACDDTRASWLELGDHLAEVTGAPIELSVIPESLARQPHPPWSYLVHVATDGTAATSRRRVVRDRGDGDPDLLMHLAVVRAAPGITVHGPEPERLVTRIDRVAILTYLHDELAWGASHADARYAVLNACRAWHYAATGEIVSKLAGGRHALSALPDYAACITAAVQAQKQGRDLGELSDDGRALVTEVQAHLVGAG